MPKGRIALLNELSKTLDKILSDNDYDLKLEQLDIDSAAVRGCSTFRQIDDLYTAPIHGFENADDYWTRASSKPGLRNIRVPTLVLNARNDPLVPAWALPGAGEVSAAVTLEQPEQGGHAGFVTGRFPGNLDWLPQRVFEFFGGIFPAPPASSDS